MNVKDLEDYAAAWNNHDVDTIMSYMTDDCVFETGGGTERWGTRIEGAADVRERFIEVWTELPDVQFLNGSHFVSGDRGCSEWTFKGTNTKGEVTEVDGCDLFTFVGDKIRVKNSLIKIRR